MLGKAEEAEAEAEAEGLVRAEGVGKCDPPVDDTARTWERWFLRASSIVKTEATI